MKQRGDTLIEVLFAFVILGVVISVAFSGALSSYRSVVSAQNRTQATFAAQYQAGALETYRKSVDFDTLYGDEILSNNQLGFCMTESKNDNTGDTYWKIIGKFNDTAELDGVSIIKPDDCDSFAKKLASGLDQPELTIKATKTSDKLSIIANITLEWNSNNSSQRESVTSTVILTKGTE